MAHRYYVYTWDTYKQAFTPQAGVPPVRTACSGSAMRCTNLRTMGYAATREDPSVYVERDEGGGLTAGGAEMVG